uniref:60-kDa chaperonin n=1 Tax=Neustupella aerophytica TaxID=2962111 RepID=UPI0021823301|nr:60-kDa chaperonin [Neustupella aerophytica]UVI61167.1 60-kDa chaperonin [Neustupella aerophytica]
MTHKQYILSYEHAQLYIENGIKKLGGILEETYGPSGKNILLDSKKANNPELLKSGSKIIRSLRTSDSVQNLILLLFEDSFQKINSTSGDGTKTFFLITSFLILNGFKHVIQNASALETKIGITKTITYTLNILQDKSIPITNRKFWNKIIDRFIPSDDNLRIIFKEAFEKIGKSGDLKIKTETGKNTNLTIERGMQINTGFFSPYFVTDTEKMVVNFENPYVLVTLQSINLEDGVLLKILEPIIYEKRPLLIVSPDIEEQALSSLILNKINGIFDVAYVKLPQVFTSDKAIFEDLALYTKAKCLNSFRDWKGITRSDLGQAERILITKTKTICWSKLNSQEEIIQKKCQELKQQILTSDSDYENEKRENRRRNLSGATAIINIGGVTDLETTDRRSRAQLGLTGARACLYEGVLPGGGFSFVHLSEEVENWSRSNFYTDSLIGSNLVSKSLIRPIQVLLSQNIDRSNIIPKYSTSIDQIKKINDIYMAYDIKNQQIISIFESGILDSFKSIRLCLQTALSLAYSILSIATMIV